MFFLAFEFPGRSLEAYSFCWTAKTTAGGEGRDVDGVGTDAEPDGSYEALLEVTERLEVLCRGVDDVINSRDITVLNDAISELELAYDRCSHVSMGGWPGCAVDGSCSECCLLSMCCSGLAMELGLSATAILLIAYFSSLVCA